VPYVILNKIIDSPVEIIKSDFSIYDEGGTYQLAKIVMMIPPATKPAFRTLVPGNNQSHPQNTKDE